MTTAPPPVHPLRMSARPEFEQGTTVVTEVDLFSGCGGLSLGVAQACHDIGAALDIRLSVDFDANALTVLATNFPKANSVIGDLAELVNGSGIDQAPTASGTNLQRMRWLLDNGQYDLPNALRPKCHQGDHSYVSMYGRLSWDKPAQTLTSGFGSIGQGRYMHPDLTRALTPHEAARIQGFPDYFEFAPLPTRASLATMIANAVPPELARRVIGQVLPSLT